MLEKSSHPQISVLIPVYNVERYVERCILSVLNQTMQEGVEVIIVNDCTPDHSMEIIREVLRTHLKENGMTVRIVEHETNRGLAAVRNTAMSYATGRYIIHVDSDDYVEPDMLEKMYAKAVDTNADIIGCDFYIDYQGYKQIQKFNFLPYPEYNLKELIEGHYWGLIWTRLVRKDLYINNNLSFIEKLDYGEGFIMLIKLHYYAKVVGYVSQPLYNYVKYNTQSITYLLNPDKINQRIKTHLVIEQFLREKYVYNWYEISFLKSCFWAKLPLVLNKEIRDLKYWKSIKPECHKYIMQFDYSFKFKLFCLLICKIPSKMALLILYFVDRTYKKK